MTRPEHRAAQVFAGSMAVNLIHSALAVSFTLYTLAGIAHEELRLRAAYGPAHDRYRRAVPFLLPRLSRAPREVAEGERAT